MRADKPIQTNPYLVGGVVVETDYINQLRVDRLMRGKKIAELKRYIEWLEWRVDGNTKQRDNMHQCAEIAKAYEARANKIKEGM